MIIKYGALGHVMKIVAFVGMPASGKSEASHVAEGMGIPRVIMGDVVREEVRLRGLEPTDKNTGMVATSLREDESMDAIARRCIPKIHDLIDEGAEIVVVDGVRGIAEVNLFRAEFGHDFDLIAIDSPIEVRLSRVKQRGRSDDMSDLEGLRIRDERELGWGLGEAIESADVVIDNDGELSDFRHEIANILANIDML